MTRKINNDSSLEYYADVLQVADHPDYIQLYFKESYTIRGKTKVPFFIAAADKLPERLLRLDFAGYFPYFTGIIPDFIEEYPYIVISKSEVMPYLNSFGQKIYPDEQCNLRVYSPLLVRHMEEFVSGALNLIGNTVFLDVTKPHNL